MLTPKKNILIVEDEEDLSELIAISLTRLGFEVYIANHIQAAKQFLNQQVFDLILTDMRLPDGLGLEIIELACQLKIKSIMMTAYASTEDAITALKLGALDYLTKPVSLEKLRQKILDILNPCTDTSNIFNKANTATRIQTTVNPAKKIIDNLLIGQSPSIQKLKQNIEQYANSAAPIVIFGQTGTGKERVAQALHFSSQRAKNPMITINCASIPEALLESELFGYRKGAFSGAQERKTGLIQAAHQGTLFLDEIAEMPLALQSKLLRVLQERKVRALGDTIETDVDIKIICATHQNLSENVNQGRFREDLFYRIHVLAIELPTLNQRRDDIPLLLEYFLEKIIKTHHSHFYQKIDVHKHPISELIEEKAIQILQQLNYPGNIRQLENILQVAYLNAQIEAAQIIRDNELAYHSIQIKARHLDVAHLTSDITISNNMNANNSNNELTNFTLSNTEKVPHLFMEQKIPFNLPAYIIEIENHYIKQAIQIYGFNQSIIAKSLGLSLRQLRYRLEQKPELFKNNEL